MGKVAEVAKKSSDGLKTRDGLIECDESGEIGGEVV